MKKSILLCFLLGGLLAAPLVPLTGCKSPSQQKVAVNTLFSLHKTADAALDGYLDLVVSGKVSTNSVPAVTKAYDTFQKAFNAAVTLVANNTNAVAPQSLVDSLNSFTTAISTAKGGK